MSRELKSLIRAITLWNESRLDLFEISQPDKNDEFHGVIRFYHQDSTNDGKYATKCVRVSNTASTLDVIETLSEKFRSDMRMLTKPKYTLYEVHVNGESRKLKNNEHPLTVQLNWIKDDREGRFLLHNEDDKRPVQAGNGLYVEGEDTMKSKNLTKKEKKQKKKKDKANVHASKEDIFSPGISQEDSAVKQLFNEVPESTFTRTVSNPEAVMKKRREQKLQKRGAERLKIYGDSINKDIPYKTLLLLPNDDTDAVVRDTLDKYGLGKEKTSNYMIVKVVLPPGSKPEECLEGGWGKETILEPDDCPLDIEQNWQPHQGTLVFQLRPSTISRRKQKSSSSSLSRSEEKLRKTSSKDQENSTRRKEHSTPTEKSARPDHENAPRPSKRPKLLEILGPDKVVTHPVGPNVTEIGYDRHKASYGPYIELRQVPGLLPSHCVITNMEGVVTVTPQDNDGEVFVDGKIIEETTMLSHANIVWLGRGKHLVFCDPERNISITEIQRKIRATQPREQPRRNNPTSNPTRQRDGSTSYVSTNRPRHHSATSSSSSRSGSALHGRGALQEQKSLQNIRENGTLNSQKRKVQSQPALVKAPSEKSLQHRSAPQTATVQPIQQANSHRLPASVQVQHNLEESLISEIFSTPGNSLHFKLSPAYTIYLIQRYFVDVHPEKVLQNLVTIADLLEQTIQMSGGTVSELAFWMANASELLNFMRQDQDLSPLTMELQDDFAKIVQLSFRHLVQCMQRTLFDLMPGFLSESDEDLPGGGEVVDLKKMNRNTAGPTMYDILHMLSSAMSMLRRCRVNAALTIQLFSQLFHSVNMWLFNKLVASSDAVRLCCRQWGIRIRARLAMVESWAERQGLELAADCHLARITQATYLLQAPKYTGDDIAAISGTCFKLNSLQLGVLLSNYEPDERGGEKRISQDLIDKVVAVAEDSADELMRSDGRDVQLEEDPDLQLPFLLPEDGYSCDVIRGVPSGLTEFLQPLQHEGFCTYDIESNTSGNWTVHFQSILQQYQNAVRSSRGSESTNQQPSKAEIISISFRKLGGGMGLSIVAARGVGQEKSGIYIRSVVQGGAADLDGRLQAGDQLLSVDGETLVGVDQSRAAELMTQSGQIVTLEIAKQGAVYHGLAKMLSQPSPKTQRRANPQQSQVRPRSEGYALHANQVPKQAGGQSAHSRLFEAQGRTFASQANHMSAINHSTPHLNEAKPKLEPVTPTVSNTPRSAISMGNLQQTISPSATVTDSPKSWKKQIPSRASEQQSSNMSNMRRKATSQTALSPASNTQQTFGSKVYNGQVNSYTKRDFFSKSTPSPAVSSPRDSLPSPPSIVGSRPAAVKFSPNSLDNPNYEHFPPPPPNLASDKTKDASVKRQFTPVSREASTPPVDPVQSVTPVSVDSNRSHRHSTSPAHKETPSPRSNLGSKTLDRPSSAKKTEVARVAPTQKKKVTSPISNKSSTLPRHFKSASSWVRDEREKMEQSIQEELNAQRDQEIEQLSARNELNPTERERLNTLLQEREFQARVQEEKNRLFSDDDLSEEDYSVPDRPDRDRLIRLEGAHALRDAAVRVTTADKEDEDHLRWKEEQQRKKEEAEIRAKQEAERREERRRERERAERERLEEKRKRELQQQLEREKYEEEQRMVREKEEEWRESYNSLQREEEEQRRRLEEIRRLREEEENQLRDLQRKREAEAREEAEREFLENKLSAGKPSGYSSTYKQFAPVSPRGNNNVSSSTNRYRGSYKRSTSPISTASNISRSSPGHDSNYSRPFMRENPKPSSARPVSDGYALGKTDWSSDDLPPPPTFVPTTPPATHNSRRPVSYVSSTTTPKVIGAQEIYNDPRNKREATLKRDQSLKRRGPDPSRMTFKDRQRLFQGGKSSPISKPKSSRKLMELEQSLRGQM